MNSNMQERACSGLSISDDELCATCVRLEFYPGEVSFCAEGWTGSFNPDGYCTHCSKYEAAGGCICPPDATDEACEVCVPCAAPVAELLSLGQLDILMHTGNSAAGGLYCGDSADMQELVRKGLMVSAGRKSFAPDEYFKLTKHGKAVLEKLTC